MFPAYLTTALKDGHTLEQNRNFCLSPISNKSYFVFNKSILL